MKSRSAVGGVFVLVMLALAGCKSRVFNSESEQGADVEFFRRNCSALKDKDLNARCKTTEKIMGSWKLVSKAARGSKSALKQGQLRFLRPLYDKTNRPRPRASSATNSGVQIPWGCPEEYLYDPVTHMCIVQVGLVPEVLASSAGKSGVIKNSARGTSYARPLGKAGKEGVLRISSKGLPVITAPAKRSSSTPMHFDDLSSKPSEFVALGPFPPEMAENCSLLHRSVWKSNTSIQKEVTIEEFTASAVKCRSGLVEHRFAVASRDFVVQDNQTSQVQYNQGYCNLGSSVDPFSGLCLGPCVAEKEGGDNEQCAYGPFAQPMFPACEVTAKIHATALSAAFDNPAVSRDKRLLPDEWLDLALFHWVEWRLDEELRKGDNSLVWAEALAAKRKQIRDTANRIKTALRRGSFTKENWPNFKEAILHSVLTQCRVNRWRADMALFALLEADKKAGGSETAVNIANRPVAGKPAAANPTATTAAPMRAEAPPPSREIMALRRPVDYTTIPETGTNGLAWDDVWKLNGEPIKDNNPSLRLHPVARCTGRPEGTIELEPLWKPTSAYGAHIDPGNGARNCGVFSVQSSTCRCTTFDLNDISRAEQCYMERSIAPKKDSFVTAILKSHERLNYPVLDYLHPLPVAIFINMQVQSPDAASGGGGFLDRMTDLPEVYGQKVKDDDGGLYGARAMLYTMVDAMSDSKGSTYRKGGQPGATFHDMSGLANVCTNQAQRLYALASCLHAAGYDFKFNFDDLADNGSRHGDSICKSLGM